MRLELLKTQNEIGGLPALSELSYERIFKVIADNEHYAYNILKSVNIPGDLDSGLFYYTRIEGKMSWGIISYEFYSTIRLWWLICATNKIRNPVFMPKAGTIIKIIKPEYVTQVLDIIKRQI